MSTLEMLIRHLRFVLFMVLLAWVITVGSIHVLKSGAWEEASLVNLISTNLPPS